MKIEQKKYINEHLFSDIEPGEAFKCGGYKDKVFIKIDNKFCSCNNVIKKKNAICLKTGEVWAFADKSVIKKVNAKVVVDNE